MMNSLIDRTIGFPLGSVAETETAFTTPLGEGRFSYARRENPTVSACEHAVAELEVARRCVLAPCGMAAINIALSIFNDPNDTRPYLFPEDVYSGTKEYATEVLHKQRGVSISFAEPAAESSSTANLIRAIEEETPALVFVEPISNPHLDIIDVPKVAEAAHRNGARVVVDNTFATPYLYHPLAAGADIVVHSATKYLGGHNDVLAGAICVNDPDLQARLLTHRNMIGAVLSPDDAGRLRSQLLTFPIRLARQNENAEEVAAYLEAHPGVSRVRYPGLGSHAGHELAGKMFERRGFGAMITFDLARDAEGSSRFVDDLAPCIPHIGSLGDVHTSFLHVKACFGEGYSASSIRLSVGIEPVGRITGSLAHALDAATG